MKSALSAKEEELWQLVRDPHPEVLSNATLNRNLSEGMAVFVAKNKGASAETLGFLAGDVRFKNSHKLKLALCKNPKTPPKVSMTLLKFLRIFDLADLSRNHLIPINVRQRIEFNISEKSPSIPSGIKTALAKRANSNIVIKLMQDSDERVVSSCLGSPILTEAHLYKLIGLPATRAPVIKAIATHPKWSLQHSIKFALVRNFHTPTVNAVEFLRSLKTQDLRDLYIDTKVPTSTKPFIFRELTNERGESLQEPEEQVYEVSEYEFTDVQDIETEYRPPFSPKQDNQQDGDGEDEEADEAKEEKYEE